MSEGILLYGVRMYKSTPRRAKTNRVGYRQTVKIQTLPTIEIKTRSAILRDGYLARLNANNRTKIQKSVGVDKTLTVGFSSHGNKHLYSDTFGRSKVLRKRDLKNIVNMLERSEYVISSNLYKPRKDKIKAFHYFKVNIRGRDIYLHVGEEQYSNGKSKRRYLYAISDSLKLKDEHTYIYGKS